MSHPLSTTIRTGRRRGTGLLAVLALSLTLTASWAGDAGNYLGATTSAQFSLNKK